jgi:hypothetical protein
MSPSTAGSYEIFGRGRKCILLPKYSQTRFLINAIFWAQASLLGLSAGKENKISK